MIAAEAIAFTYQFWVRPKKLIRAFNNIYVQFYLTIVYIVSLLLFAYNAFD